MSLQRKRKDVHIYQERNDEYDHDDEFIEVRRSNLRRSRNAHVGIGVGIGIISTLAFQYVMLWVLNVV